MLYELRQYDTTLLTFNVERKELDNFVFDIVRINDKYKYLLPIGMTEDSDGLFKWLKSRVIPKNREFVDQILAKSGLARNDVMGIINVCKGLSLNDSYWVVEQGFEGEFEKYNLYQNKFATTLALIAYTGYGSNGKRGFTSSPEFTTNGALKKCWRRRGGGIYLYKGYGICHYCRGRRPRRPMKNSSNFAIINIIFYRILIGAALNRPH